MKFSFLSLPTKNTKVSYTFENHLFYFPFDVHKYCKSWHNMQLTLCCFKSVFSKNNIRCIAINRIKFMERKKNISGFQINKIILQIQFDKPNDKIV